MRQGARTLSVVVLFSVFVPWSGTPKTNRVGHADQADMGEEWFDPSTSSGLTNHGCHVCKALDVGLDSLVH